jgi:uncharacterized damage-inducible protein DinB
MSGIETEFIRTLYAYNTWANERILSTSAQLTPERFLADGGASFGSVRDTLVHTMGAQWIWLSRWQGVSPRAVFSAHDFPDLAAIRARWAEIEHDTHLFVGALAGDSLARVIAYTNTKGKPFAYPLWQLMFHQVNHATQHRSEMAALLTQSGHSPGDLDFVRYLDGLKPSRS